MQRIKQLAMGAFSMAIATTGLAYAGDDHAQKPADTQGGRNGQPAPQTGSAAASDPTMSHSQGSVGHAPNTASGANRMQIEQMQRELAQRGLYQGEIDGKAGPQTLAAVRQFQQQQGLPASGGFDEATRQALGIQLDRQPVAGAQTSASPELERPVGREGATPAISGNRPMRSQVQLDTLNQEQLRTLQTRLQELGFYQGQVDGVLGEGTRSALRQFFQTQADLATRGIITDATVNVFGVSPQGLNGASPLVPTSSQRGVQPRGTEPRGSMSPSGGNSSGNSTGTRSNGSTEMNVDTNAPNGSTSAPNRSTPPMPGGSGSNGSGSNGSGSSGTGSPSGSTGSSSGTTGSPR